MGEEDSSSRTLDLGKGSNETVPRPVSEISALAVPADAQLRSDRPNDTISMFAFMALALGLISGKRYQQLTRAALKRIPLLFNRGERS